MVGCATPKHTIYATAVRLPCLMITKRPAWHAGGVCLSSWPAWLSAKLAKSHAYNWHAGLAAHSLCTCFAAPWLLVFNAFTAGLGCGRLWACVSQGLGSRCLVCPTHYCVLGRDAVTCAILPLAQRLQCSCAHHALNRNLCSSCSPADGNSQQLEPGKGTGVLGWFLHGWCHEASLTCTDEIPCWLL